MLDIHIIACLHYMWRLSGCCEAIQTGRHFSNQQRLEESMKKLAKVFVTERNNGVIALATLETALDHMRSCRLAALTKKRFLASPYHGNSECVDRLAHSGPIFTFAHSDRVSDGPWFTGTYELHYHLTTWLAEQGVTFMNGLYVPFSNGLEVGLHGEDAMRAELRYVTTHRDFIDVFGITPSELMAKP